MKSDIQFHLYISTAPCGDGALFSPRYAHFENLNNLPQFNVEIKMSCDKKITCADSFDKMKW